VSAALVVAARSFLVDLEGWYTKVSSRLVVEKIKYNKEAAREVEVVPLNSRYSA
jgi:hypothetical protein